MNSIIDNALNEAAIANEEDKLVDRVQNIFSHLRKDEGLDVNSPSQFEDLMTNAVSHSVRYELAATYVENGDMVYEIENSARDLTDIVKLSYDDEGQMYTSLKVRQQTEPAI